MSSFSKAKHPHKRTHAGAAGHDTTGPVTGNARDRRPDEPQGQAASASRRRHASRERRRDVARDAPQGRDGGARERRGAHAAHSRSPPQAHTHVPPSRARLHAAPTRGAPTALRVSPRLVPLASGSSRLAAPWSHTPKARRCTRSAAPHRQCARRRRARRPHSFPPPSPRGRR